MRILADRLEGRRPRSRGDAGARRDRNRPADPVHPAGLRRIATCARSRRCSCTSPRGRRTSTSGFFRPGNAGAVVLSDRFTDSTLAYQGGGRGLGPDVVMQLHNIACHGLQPDLTICIDIDTKPVWSARGHATEPSGSDGGAGDRVPQTGPGNLSGTRAQFTRSVSRSSMAAGRIEDVAERVWEVVGRSCLNLSTATRRGRDACADDPAGPDSANHPAQRAGRHRQSDARPAVRGGILGDRDKIEHDDLSLPENVALICRPREVAGGQANRRSAAVRLASGLRDVPARWSVAADLNPADALAEGARAVRAACGASYRVFLIDHLDRANEQAANSLLKILEEPPAYLLLFMTAENAYDLLPTIRSRSLILGMSPLSARRDGRCSCASAG